MKTNSLCAALAMLFSLMLALAVTGCASLSGNARFAAVTITNRTEKVIAAATVEVFRAEGYRGGMTGSGRMVFEKEASHGTTLAREGLVDTYYGARTLNRVKVEILQAGLDVHRLQCEAFVVQGAGDAFFEDEVRLSKMRSGPYQALLNKVAEQLK